tara:strand:+ start:52 stop:708 length:657 start_codon:yes stop_codon:yes gene_type:complete
VIIGLASDKLLVLTFTTELAMSLTKVQIISNALLQLGHAPISSLSGGDKLVVAAESVYDIKITSVLSRSNWRFATQIQQLSVLAETPPSQWETTYALPAGFLKTIRMYPNIYNWDIYADQKIYALYTGDLFMEYIFLPDVSLFPAHFVDYFTYEISTALALSNAQKAEYYPLLNSQRIQQQGLAMAIEAQNRPNFHQADIPVLNQRNVSSYTGFGFTQ